MIQDGKNGEKHVFYQLGEHMDDIQEQVFRMALENNSYSRTKTAKSLSVCMRTVRNWLKKYGITTPNQENS